MKNKKITYILIVISIIILLSLIIFLFVKSSKKDNKISTDKLEATILNVSKNEVTVMDKHNNIYKLQFSSDDLKSGDVLVIEYTGILDELKSSQDIEIISYSRTQVERDENGIPVNWKDNGIFSSYYVMAYNKLKELSIDEKIGQLLLVRYPNSGAIDALKDYKLSGFVFFERDFRNKSKKQVQDMINNLQSTSNIPLLTAVDEEGGNFVRVSSNSSLVPERFKSPQELYNLGGFEKIKSDTIKKSEVLKDLGLNVNLAPVVDVSTNPSDYIYNRTLGENTGLTSKYAEVVIEASKGTGVSYTLKHFPGYGNNQDTHIGASTDTRSYNDILNNDIPPFKAGIDVGAEAVIVSHNTVTNIDNNNPASLSPTVHNLLRNDLNFTGVIITDDIAMGALTTINDPTIKAVLAGNDLIITTDYQQSFNEIKTAIDNGTIDESIIDHLAFRVLAWKYSKGLMLSQK